MAKERKYLVHKSPIVSVMIGDKSTYCFVKMDGKKVPVVSEEGKHLSRSQVKELSKAKEQEPELAPAEAEPAPDTEDSDK